MKFIQWESLIERLIRRNNIQHFTLSWYLTGSNDLALKKEGQPTSNRLVPVSTASELTLQDIVELYNHYPDREDFGLSSRVITNDWKIGHIPMMDIDVNDLDKVKEIATNIQKEFGLDVFVIAKSTTNYHVYFLEIILEDKWLEYMDRLSQIPEVDQKWIRYSKIREYTTLRWSAQTDAKETEPTILEE